MSFNTFNTFNTTSLAIANEVVLNGEVISLSRDNLLGKGHFGAVYALSDKKVIKIFLEACTVQLEFDAQFAAWVCGLAPAPYSCGKDDTGYSYIIMDRVHPVQPEAFSFEELLAFAQAAEVKLAVYHELGWAHNDIERPVGHGIWDNVLVTKEGIVLLDYGIASHMGYEMEDDQEYDRISLKDWIAEMHSLKSKQLKKKQEA